MLQAEQPIAEFIPAASGGLIAKFDSRPRRYRHCLRLDSKPLLAHCRSAKRRDPIALLFDLCEA